LANLVAGSLMLAGVVATPSLAQDAKPAAAAAPKPACAAPKAPPKDLVKKDLAPGTGRETKFRTAVVVHYTGWLYDGCAADLKGAEFDSSRGRPTPFGFMVGAGRVIKGWDEGVIGMKETGAKRLLVIPPDKAYGDKSVAGGKIPANSTLVFEVETINFAFYPADEEPAKK
jgi:FKBP-type peptidyl-prolyl cis-trans isomerase